MALVENLGAGIMSGVISTPVPSMSLKNSSVFSVESSFRVMSDGLIASYSLTAKYLGMVKIEFYVGFDSGEPQLPDSRIFTESKYIVPSQSYHILKS